MNEIIALLSKYGIELIETVEPILVEEAKAEALKLAKSMLVSANHFLTTIQAKEQSDKLFHGKIIDEVEVKGVEIWISVLKAEISLLQPAQPATN
jgi:hypothetical protein